MSFLGLLVAALLGGGLSSGGAFRELAPGLEHAHLAEVGGEVFRFDLARYRADVVVTGAEGARTAAELRSSQRATVAVNGGFFDTAGRSLGLRIAGGRTMIGLRPRVDWGVLVVRDDRASIVHSKDFTAESGITAAIQVGPRLLVEGAPTPLKPQWARRTAVALDRDGRKLAVIVTRRSVEAAALAGILRRLGFWSALLLDGGPSTQLSVAAGAFELDVPGGYPVPDALIVRPR